VCGCVRAHTYRIHHTTICLRPAQLPATSIVLLVVHPIHRIRSAPEMCCRCVHVREYARARAYANAVHGAGGAPRQAQVLTAGAGMASPAGAHFCRQECKFRQDCNCRTAIAFSCPQWTPAPAGGRRRRHVTRCFERKKANEFLSPSFQTVHLCSLCPFSHSLSHSPFGVHPARLSLVRGCAVPPVHIWAWAATTDRRATSSVISIIWHTHVTMTVDDHCPCTHSRGGDAPRGKEKGER